MASSTMSRPRLVVAREPQFTAEGFATGLRRTDALYELTDRLQRAQSLDEVYEAALAAMAEAIPCERASILLYDEARVMRFVAWRGLSDQYRRAVEGHSPWHPDVTDPEPVCIPDVASADLGAEIKETIARENIRAAAFIPLVSSGRLIGKFMTYFAAPHAHDVDELEVSLIIARQLAFAIDRRRAYEALLASEQRFREMIDALPAAIYTTDAQGHLTHFNRAAIEFSGRVPQLGTDEWCVSWKLYRPDGSPLPHAECPMAISLREGVAIRDAEAIAERPDGTRRWFTPYPTPLRDADGRIVGGINMLVDITERKRMENARRQAEQALADSEARLREADRRKDQFLAMLAHELRNPLAPIVNALQLLDHTAATDPIQGQATAIINRQVALLARLVDDLLEVSRITSGRIQLHLDRIALASIAARAVETVRPLIEERRHTIAVSVPKEPVWLHADSTRIEQIIVNLLNNAAKYTPDGGSLTLSVHQDAGQAVLRVGDNGVGIEPALLPRIFELFTQSERSLDRSSGGLGIGLSLVRTLVTMHGGTVSAASVVSEGSEFTVRLPLAPGVVSQLPERRPVADSAPTGVLRVLVVDDNVDAARSLGMLLETAGHAVQVAHDGRAALATALAFRPQVVFLDIGLPLINGYEVARQLRQQPANRKALLIAMTGYGQQSDREDARKAGFDHHIAKPAYFSTLQEILAKAAAAADGKLTRS